MDQLVATYGTRRSTSLATTATSTAAQPLDPKQWEALAQKQNVPGFLLLDAVRFYKRGQTAQETLTPVVNSAKEDVDNVKKEIQVLRDDFRKDQERLGKVETSVDDVSKGLERLEGELDTIRRDSLRTNLDAKKNGRDVADLAVRFDALEKQLSVLLAQERHNLRMRDETRAHVMELSGVIARMEQTGLSQLHNHLATLSSGRVQYHHAHPPHMLAQTIGYHSQASQVPLFDQTQAAPITGYNFNPAIAPYEPRDSGLSSRYNPFAPQGSINSLPNPSQHTYPDPGEETASEASEVPGTAYNPNSTSQRHGATVPDPFQRYNPFAPQGSTTLLPNPNQHTVSPVSAEEIAFPAPNLRASPNLDLGGVPDPGQEIAPETSDSELSDITQGTAAEATRAYLANLLKESQKSYRQNRPKHDRKFIWKVIDNIKDKDLSKQLQLFLLDRFRDRYVGEPHLSRKQKEAKNKYITMVKLPWPLFVKAFRKFLRGDLRA